MFEVQIEKPFWGKLVGALIFISALASLAACKPRAVYHTPTAEPYVAPSPLETPTVAPTPTLEPTPTDTPTPVISGPTMLRLEPSVVMGLPVGETRQVQVLLENVEQLQSVELHISFEPRYVNVEDADPEVEGVQIETGSFPVPAQVLRNEANNYAGAIIYHVSAESPIKGSGVVASFGVQALAEGGSPLRFNVVRLADSEGQELPVEEEIDGLVSIAAAGSAPEPTEAASTGAPSTTSAPVVATPTMAPSTPSSSQPTYHTVQRGENLYRIALRYGTTVDAIVAANGLANENSVYVGQVLLIPAGDQGQPQPGGTTYVVQPGDTLYSIARRFGATVDALAAHNGLAPPYTIKVGQTLSIP